MFLCACARVLDMGFGMRASRRYLIARACVSTCGRVWSVRLRGVGAERFLTERDRGKSGQNKKSAVEGNWTFTLKPHSLRTTYMCIYVHICVYVYIHICIYVYIHT